MPPKDTRDAAKRINPGDEAELEPFLSAASDVYESRTKRDDRWEKAGITRRSEPSGGSWNEEDLPKLFPRLSKKFG